VNENGKFCVTCGNPLTGKQEKYCCDRCSHLKPQKKHICQNPSCGKEYLSARKNQNYCCTKCSKEGADDTIKDPFEAANRPFTKDTRYLAQLWHKQGKSKPEIAMILGRSLENIEQAFV
jgi:hypothetical protein